MKKKIYKYDKVDWSMPLLFTESSFLIPIFYKLFKNETIKYAYGSPQCSWSGGRLSNMNTKNLKLIETVIYKIKSYKVTPSFTFTNTNITRELLRDEFCNSLLEIISESNAEVILVSDLLFEYIKSKYPNIKIAASVLKSTYQNIKHLDETEHINKLTNKYDRVVIRPEYAIIKNGNFDNIENISKLELIVNQACAMNCPCANEEYRFLELLDRGLMTKEEFTKKMSQMCPRDTGKIKELNCIKEELINKCISAGITKLKLNGRHLTFDNLLFALNNYFFSKQINYDETKNEINNYILSSVKNSTRIQIYSML